VKSDNDLKVTRYELKLDADMYKFKLQSYPAPAQLSDISSEWNLFKVYQDHYYFQKQASIRVHSN
jgi:hypothetical protein